MDTRLITFRIKVNNKRREAVRCGGRTGLTSPSGPLKGKQEGVTALPPLQRWMEPGEVQPSQTKHVLVSCTPPPPPPPHPPPPPSTPVIKKEKKKKRGGGGGGGRLQKFNCFYLSSILEGICSGRLMPLLLLPN